MVLFHVRMDSEEMVIALVEKLNLLSFDVDALIGHVEIDAKSILGMLGIGTGAEVILRAHVNDDSFIDTYLSEFSCRQVVMN